MKFIHSWWEGVALASRLGVFVNRLRGGVHLYRHPTFAKWLARLPGVFSIIQIFHLACEANRAVLKVQPGLDFTLVRPFQNFLESSEEIPKRRRLAVWLPDIG